jgi:hypothetical protein
MKKILLISSIGLVGLMTSCTKDRVCECTTTTGNQIDKTTVTLTKISSTDAKAACSNRSETFVTGSFTSSSKTECTLK